MFDPYTGEHCGGCACNLVNPPLTGDDMTDYGVPDAAAALAAARSRLKERDAHTSVPF